MIELAVRRKNAVRAQDVGGNGVAVVDTERSGIGYGMARWI